MFRIGDFSKFSRISIKTLRYYDEIGLLKPVSVDELSGYRYYSANQLPRLNRILVLKDLGLSLEEIKLLLTDNLPMDKVIELLRAKLNDTQERLRQEENRLKKVEEWLKNMEKEGTMPVNDVIIKKVEALNVASIRDIIPAYNEISRLFNEIFPYLGRQHAKFAGPTMAIYHDSEYREKNADVELAVPISGIVPANQRITVYQLPAIDQMASLIHKGPYEKLGQAYQALMSWIGANGYQIAGPNREIYLKGPGQFHKGNPDDYITEIQIPIKK